MKAKSRRDTRLGFRYGLGLGKENLGNSLTRQALDVGLTPATSYGQTLGETLGAATRARTTKALGRVLRSAAGGRKVSDKELLRAGASGTGIAALLAANNRSK